MNPSSSSTVLIRNGIRFDRDTFVVMAGPCSVESRDQVLETSAAVAAAGASMLRGGAFKPRTSPDSFQGLGQEGLALLEEASRNCGLPTVTEVMDPRDVESVVTSGAAMLQVGSRSMQNFPLLREVGRSGMPVLLKRGASATIDEFVSAAEYIYREGNQRVVLCERGLRHFDSSTRNLLDLTAVPLLKERSPAPVVVDPSHGTGHASLVPVMARAAVAAGADGLLIEVHPDPARALSDGPQALTPQVFDALMREIERWLPLVDRRIVRPRDRSVGVDGGRQILEPKPSNAPPAGKATLK